MSFCLYTNCYLMRHHAPLWNVIRLYKTLSEFCRKIESRRPWKREKTGMIRLSFKCSATKVLFWCGQITDMTGSNHWYDWVKSLKWLGQITEMTASERHYPWDRKRRTTVCRCLSVLYKKVRKNRVVAGNRPLAGENRRLVAVFLSVFPTVMLHLAAVSRMTSPLIPM